MEKTAKNTKAILRIQFFDFASNVSLPARNRLSGDFAAIFFFSFL
jgi:hypothetical protein